MVSSKFQDLTIVIPTLNEAEVIGRVLDEVMSVGVPRDNVLIIDGGSTDGTVDIAKLRGVRVVMQEGRGKADAIKTASKYVTTRYTLFMDGDYTYPAKFIDELYSKVREGYDLVIGWRLYGKESQPWIYRLGNKLLTSIFNILFGTHLHDVLSGMYIVRTEVLKELMFETRGFGIESEIVAHVVSTSGKVNEVPIEYRKRLGKKKLSVKHGLQILREIIRLTWRYNPTFFIFTLGALLLIPGLILGAYVAYHYFFTGIKYYIKGLIAIILTLAGFQSSLLAILTLYLKRWEQRMTRRLNELQTNIKKIEGSEG